MLMQIEMWRTDLYLSPTEMLKWESRLAPLFFYATVAVLKQSPMLEKSRTQRNSVRDSLEL